jgi:transposase
MACRTSTSCGRSFTAVRPFLDERACRIWAAVEAAALGRGGVTQVARATGLARSTIYEGQRDLKAQQASEQPRARRRLRREGGGRKDLAERDPTLVADLEALVDPLARGDPQSPLRWTTKSTLRLAAALQAQGHAVSYWKVGQLLRERGYRLQSTRKTKEGASRPDWDAQFELSRTPPAARDPG